MIDISKTDRFFEIEAKSINTGVSKDTIEKIYPKITDIDIKKEYLYHSHPEITEDTGSFFIGKNFITVNEFSDFINETDYLTDAEKDGWGWIWENKWKKKNGLTWRKPFGDSADNIYFGNRHILPVLMLSWNDAKSYCSWLSEKTGRKTRLPHESEWELFAETTGVIGIEEYTGKPREIYQNSSQFIDKLCKEITEKNDYTRTGIIWEWTQDWFNAYVPGNDNKEYGEIYKVLRGGSLLSNEIQRTRQYRFRRCPTARSPFYGFRILIEKS